jgi:hypothetical protein
MKRISGFLLAAGMIGGVALLFTPSEDQGASQGASVRMIASEGEGAKYWPRWRGPSGQGLFRPGFPDRWSATQNILWKTAVPGSGNSSPIIWGDRIFLTTAYDGGRRLALRAHNRTDGKLLWEAFAPEGSAESVHEKNGNASATPATDGERIYVSFGNRGLMAFDFEGKLVWRQDFGRISNYWGTAGSPLLYKDRIVLYQDQSAGAFVAARLEDRTSVVANCPRRDGGLGYAHCDPCWRSR